MLTPEGRRILFLYRDLQRVKRIPEWWESAKPLIIFGSLPLCVVALVAGWYGLAVVCFAVFITLPTLRDQDQVMRDMQKELQRLARDHQEDLLHILTEGNLNVAQMKELALAGASSSIQKEDNYLWSGFMAALRERRNQLPVAMNDWLDEFEIRHGW